MTGLRDGQTGKWTERQIPRQTHKQTDEGEMRCMSFYYYYHYYYSYRYRWLVVIDLQERMSGVEVRVDGVLCYEFGTVTKVTLTTNFTNIRCTSQLSGRIVKLTKNDNVFDQNKVYMKLLELCEVQVWGVFFWNIIYNKCFHFAKCLYRSLKL